MNHLEDRLRTGLRQEADAVRTSPDAWQENQRRLAASQRRRGAHMLATAAAVVVVLLVGGLIAVATNNADGGAPASGRGDDVFADENLLGPIVELETMKVDGKRAVHQGALSDTSGKGPSLCDQVMTVDESSGSGSCTAREPNADDAEVAIDWLTGSADGDIRGILAGVDRRVATVQIWMDNGDMVLADLKPGRWEGTKLFALTRSGDGPWPQRLVAYSGASGSSLQSVDLGDRFGDGWLPRGGKTCTGAATATWRQPGPGGTGDDVSVVLWSGSVKVTLAESDTVGATCLGLGPSLLAASTRLDAHLVVAVIAPEAEFYEVRQPPPGLRTALYPVSGTPWQVLVASVPQQSTFGETEIVVLDSSDGVLDRLFLDQLASP